MLKGAIYFNVLVLLIMSIYLFINIFTKRIKLTEIKELISVYTMFNFINIIILFSEIVYISLRLFFILPFSLLTFILNVISLICVNWRIKKSNNIDYKKIGVKRYLFIVFLPVIILVIPYIYELCVINNCDYLVKYSLSTMFGESSRSYIAIINNKPINITLQKNLFNRKGSSIEELYYDVLYNNDIEIIENDLNYEDIMEIAMDVKERVPSIIEAEIYYLQEGKYAFVYLYDENDLKVRIYFYYENNYIKSINNKEYLSEIIYYK